GLDEAVGAVDDDAARRLVARHLLGDGHGLVLRVGHAGGAVGPLALDGPAALAGDDVIDDLRHGTGGWVRRTADTSGHVLLSPPARRAGYLQGSIRPPNHARTPRPRARPRRPPRRLRPAPLRRPERRGAGR